MKNIRTYVSFFLLALIFQLQPISSGAQITRSQVIVNAMAYTTYAWTAHSSNLTPWINTSCGGHYVRHAPHLSLGTNIGMPYCWGAWSTPAVHNSLMLANVSAGDTNCSSLWNYAGAGCASGIDCSGLAARSYNITSTKPNTTMLASSSYSVPYSSLSQLLQGDMLILPGQHVMVVNSYNATSGASVIEASARDWKASARTLTPSQLTGYNPYYYNLIINTCTTPTSISYSGVTTNSAYLSWPAATSATSYELSYRQSSSSTWTIITGISGTSYTLSGLSAGTSYYIQIRDYCSSSAAWATTYATNSFTTLPPSCAAPGSLSSSSITTSSANISWPSVTFASNYELSYKSSSSSTWTTVSSLIYGTSWTLTGLAAGTTYNIRIRTYCSTGLAWSTYVSNSFTTSAACATPSSVGYYSVSGHGANVSWSSSATTFNLRLRPSGAITWWPYSWTGTSVAFSGLSLSTCYEFETQAICSGTSSAWSTSIYFCTASHKSAQIDSTENTNGVGISLSVPTEVLDVTPDHVLISPNPISLGEDLQIIGIAKGSEIILANIDGKDIETWKCTEERKAIIPIPRSLPPGVYIIKIKEINGYITPKKIVLNN